MIRQVTGKPVQQHLPHSLDPIQSIAFFLQESFASSLDHLVHQLCDPREYVPSVSGRLDERESVRQS